MLVGRVISVPPQIAHTTCSGTARLFSEISVIELDLEIIGGAATCYATDCVLEGCEKLNEKPLLQDHYQLLGRLAEIP